MVAIYCSIMTFPDAVLPYAFDVVAVFSGVLLAFSLDRAATTRDNNSTANECAWLVLCELRDNRQLLLKGDLDRLSTDAWDALLSDNAFLLPYKLQTELFPLYHRIRCQNIEADLARECVTRYKGSPIGSEAVRSPLVALARQQETKAKTNGKKIQEEIDRVLSLDCWPVKDAK